MRRLSLRRHGHAVVASVLAASLALASAALAQVADRDIASATLRAATASPAIPEINAGVRLLHHTMRGVAGKPVPATTLLLVPKGTPPAGGWPIVAWEHGTTTPGWKSCAPSQTLELDGGLTRDGFKSDYAWQVGQFIDAGYAVVAPDLEGLGPDATTPYPYYSLSSLARSLVAGVVAAREAEPRLADRWVAVGHSDGGHGVLGVEAVAGEARGLTFVGTVAIAPYVAIEAHAARFGAEGKAATTQEAALQAQMMQQFQGALMATGLKVTQPSFKEASVMGQDLATILPRFRSLCSVKAIGTVDAAVKAKGAAFRGLTTGWAQQPQMRAFLTANDPAVTPGFTLRKPVLIVQGTADPFVLEPLQTPFADQLKRSGAPVTYKRYDGADHFTIIRQADADVLAFLRERFAN